MPTPDYTHPLHRASLYVEEMKYGPGPRRIEGVTKEQVVAQVECLLRDAGVALDAVELVDDTFYYGFSLACSLGVPMQVAHSIFLDGLLHGLAVGAKLEPAEVPA